MTEDLRVLLPERIPEARDTLERLFNTALAHDPYGMTGTEICEWAEQGQVLVFLADSGQIVMAMGLVETPRGKIAELLALVGKNFRKRIAELWPDIETVCREQDCIRVLMHGRPGWRKLMATHGFGVVRTTLAKELT